VARMEYHRADESSRSSQYNYGRVYFDSKYISIFLLRHLLSPTFLSLTLFQSKVLSPLLVLLRSHPYKCDFVRTSRRVVLVFSQALFRGGQR
jgi:hypothetical protein